MMYESLLLNRGGGIITAGQQSDQYKGAAVLAIGIGGTGVAALAALKRKVYQQLIPDDPDSPTPAYRHIQFLAIDTEDSAIKYDKGKARLDEASEFLSLLTTWENALDERAKIKKDPRFAWMQAVEFYPPAAPRSPLPVRQVGRYLLIKRAGKLYHVLQQKCKTALIGLDTWELDVYIFAGLSGGIGSGCFLDTCYIVQHVLADLDIRSSSKLMGFFFLPDVVTSKPAVAACPPVVQVLNSNGYAALKELDHLMNLKEAADRFRQDYGPFQIDTDKPPVDLCHLLSAARADGTVRPDGFAYCINAATDYVMRYLADDNMGGADDNGPTLRAHLDNVATGVSLLPRAYGANLSYHLLGASCAEVPTTQIATYLAAGFNRRFHTHVTDEARTTLTKDAVLQWARELKLTEEQITAELSQGTSALSLPDIDMGALKEFGPTARGCLPAPWAAPGNAWLDTNAGKRTANRTTLNGKLSSRKVSDAADDSIVGRVFKKLCELCMDPNYGPYYAASLLYHEGLDLISYLTGTIRVAEEKRCAQVSQLTDRLSGLVVQASTHFCASGPFNRRQRYAEYKAVVTQWYLYSDRCDLYDQVTKTLRKALDNLLELYARFFKPLIRMLDNLNQTFEYDLALLDYPATRVDTGYTWHILEPKDVKPCLDAAAAALTDRQLVGDFLQRLLDDPDIWLTNDESKIGPYISEHMANVFSAELDRSLQDWLFEMFPAAGGNIYILARGVYDHILPLLDSNADTVFWGDPQCHCGSSFDIGVLSVPHIASAVCLAALEFKSVHNEYITVWDTGLRDRIFALKLYSGVPLYAYPGLGKLKEDYDAVRSTEPGIGAHLFADTGRAPCDVPEMNWRDFLPSPVPYSYDPAQAPNGPAVMELYDRAVQEGVICKDWVPYRFSNNTFEAYFIHRSGDIDVPAYTRTSFLKDGELQTAELLKAKQDLQKKLDELHADSTRPNWIEMRNDGDPTLGEAVVERVRRDHFIRSPHLQKIVQQELDKKHRLENAIRTLDAILEDEAGNS